jgi:hypothetical protein
MRTADTASGTMTAHIRLLWMVRHPDHVLWVLDQLRDARAAMADPEALQVDIYVTDTGPPKGGDEGAATLAEVSKEAGSRLDKEAASEGESEGESEWYGVPPGVLARVRDVGTLHRSRPYLPDLLRQLKTERRVCVFGMWEPPPTR